MDDCFSTKCTLCVCVWEKTITRVWESWVRFFFNSHGLVCWSSCFAAFDPLKIKKKMREKWEKMRGYIVAASPCLLEEKGVFRTSTSRLRRLRSLLMSHSPFLLRYGILKSNFGMETKNRRPACVGCGKDGRCLREKKKWIEFARKRIHSHGATIAESREEHTHFFSSSSFMR